MHWSICCAAEPRVPGSHSPSVAAVASRPSVAAVTSRSLALLLCQSHEISLRILVLVAPAFLVGRARQSQRALRSRLTRVRAGAAISCITHAARLLARPRPVHLH